MLIKVLYVVLNCMFVFHHLPNKFKTLKYSSTKWASLFLDFLKWILIGLYDVWLLFLEFQIPMDHLCMFYLYSFIWVDYDPWFIHLVEWVEEIMKFVIVVKLRATPLLMPTKTSMPIMQAWIREVFHGGERDGQHRMINSLL